MESEQLAVAMAREMTKMHTASLDQMKSAMEMLQTSGGNAMEMLQTSGENAMEKTQEAKALDHQREIKIAELNAQVAEVNAAREKHLADQETAKQLNLTTSMQAMHLQVANMKVEALAREMSATLVGHSCSIVSTLGDT